MHRKVFASATIALLVTSLVTGCSSDEPVDDSKATLSRPGHGSNPDEGARTLVDEKGSGGFATRVDIPRSAKAVRVSVSCAPTGTWVARIGDSESGADGECNPGPGATVMLEYGLVGRQSFSLRTSPGRWWLVIESIDHVSSF